MTAKRSPGPGDLLVVLGAGMQLAELLLTVVGYKAMTELGWISAIVLVSRETDDSVAVKLEEEDPSQYSLATQRGRPLFSHGRWLCSSLISFSVTTLPSSASSSLSTAFALRALLW